MLKYLLPLSIILVAVTRFIWKVRSQKTWLQASGSVLYTRRDTIDSVISHRFTKLDLSMEPLGGERYPTIEFTSQCGVKVIKEVVNTLQYGPTSAGKRVAVLYNPTDPREFCNPFWVRRFSAEFIMTAFSIFFAVIFFLGGSE
ncbi:MAG: DUF3592 domain-containing protein [Verrucomicrobia bacterium]|nr:DUF3592 domain-containing protein [Verrucomicrobiota bacterium]MCH8510260.1 DUF3592 domain-containing protein [Kiritimatiellia bacterium]